MNISYSLEPHETAKLALVLMDRKNAAIDSLTDPGTAGHEQAAKRIYARTLLLLGFTIDQLSTVFGAEVTVWAIKSAADISSKSTLATVTSQRRAQARGQNPAADSDLVTEAQCAGIAPKT